MQLRDKVVLIIGGSRGLGLATAREFGSAGAIVAICAQHRAELARARADLISRGICARTFARDITDRAQVESMIAKVAWDVGPIDVLVNNAGGMPSGPPSKMKTEDFDRAMDVIFRGTLHTTFAVAPAMRRRKQGGIVNITSIGRKVSRAHLLPYSCAKFAAVALSEGLRAELAPAGIHVTTIVPELSIPAKRAARDIVRTTVRNDSEAMLSAPAEILARLHGLTPGLVDHLLSMVNRMLSSQQSMHAGHEVEARLTSRIWKRFTLLGQTAAESGASCSGVTFLNPATLRRIQSADVCQRNSCRRAKHGLSRSSPFAPDQFFGNAWRKTANAPSNHPLANPTSPRGTTKGYMRHGSDTAP